jgi:uncharacterized protein (DUF1919 family)
MGEPSKPRPISSRLISDIRYTGESLLKPITRRNLRARLHNPNFTIIASNCIGTRIYQELGLEYNTPFVGLLLFAPCFVKLAGKLEYYLKSDLRFVDKSRYEVGNFDATRGGHYPIGLLNNEIELHFIYCKDAQEAESKWTRRVRRINMSNLFFTFTDRDLCSEALIKQFDEIPYEHKVCFTAREFPAVKSCVWISEYRGQPYVADLYSNFHVLRRHFDFVDWLNGGTGTRK